MSSSISQAKDAVKNFVSKSGQHDTTVHETISPAVKNETVKPVHHENIATAVDREVHQDHYHTSVQPVHDREVLPEKHSHNVVGTEHRHFEHDNARNVKDNLATEAAKFKDQRTVHDTKHTTSTAPTVGGEHVHHHVHESVQPVIHKETIQPSVTHTTVPIHEVHHNASTHHASSALPAMSMGEYKQSGGVLGGREERVDGFQGEPKAYAATHGTHGTHGTGSTTGTSGLGSSTTGTTGLGSSTTGTHGTTGATGLGSSTTGTHGTTGTTGLGSSTTGTHGTHSTHGTHGTHGTSGTSGLGSSTTGTTGTSGLGSSTTGTTGTSGLGSSTTGRSTHNGSGLTGSSATGTGSSATGTGSSATGTDSYGTGASTTTKPSLMDKLNPKVDSTGDGKAGFMK